MPKTCEKSVADFFSPVIITLIVVVLLLIISMIVLTMCLTMDGCYYRRRIRKLKEAQNNKHLAQQGVMSSVQKSLDTSGAGAQRFGFNMATGGGIGAGPGGMRRGGAI